jgi:hypothetical protein
MRRAAIVAPGAVRSPGGAVVTLLIVLPFVEPVVVL